MSIMLFLSIAVLCFAFFVFLFAICSKKSSLGRLPPGPRGLPLLGHLHMLGELPHRSLHCMAKKYGPIMHIRIGLVPVIVASSPEYAELFLKTHDAVFADRPKNEAAEYLNYGNKGLILAHYGPHWRNMRKLCTLELLSISKLKMFKPMRKQEIAVFIAAIKITSESGSSIDITEKIGSVIENMTCRMLFGVKDDDKVALKETIEEMVKLVGVFSIADYIPFLAALDIQGHRLRMKKVSKAMDGFLENLINEHLKDADTLQGRHRHFIDVMISLMNSSITPEEHFDRDNMKAILVDMLAAGMDTTATAIEWVVTELIKHPSVMKLVQQELEYVVGLDRMVEEDLVKLEYLKMVVKESMRLHPVGPLIAHRSMEDTSVNGYLIPKKSIIMINIWAIGRVPNVWSSNAQEFYPERFIGSMVDVQGRDFQLLPFGSGRRKCVGLRLGLTVVEHVVAQLVHCFDSKLPYGLLPKDLDS
ncbi:hypothetical protein ACHQM5_021688 [Ranunculus cassubicifolius]